MNAGPDATAKRSASRIVLIFIVVSQDGMDMSYVMRFWDIVSLATDTEGIGVAAEETRCEIALFQFSHSLVWERCTRLLFIQRAFDPAQ